MLVQKKTVVMKSMARIWMNDILLQGTFENNERTHWIKSLGLSQLDLLGNEWLSDTCIYTCNCCNAITALKNSILITMWVCVSNNNCSLHTVDVFDSIRGFSVNSSSLKNQSAAILKTPTSSFNINFIDVQTQMGANDCGIFAIAFEAALCSGRDPHMEASEQNKMRILQCRKIRQFPSTTK